MARSKKQRIDTGGGDGQSPFGESLSQLGELDKLKALEPGPSAGATPVRTKKGRALPVSIRRETQGRGGSAVIVVYDFPAGQGAADRKRVLKHLQAACASGGSVKDNQVEIQGEHLEQVREVLETLGYRVTQRGG